MYWSEFVTVAVVHLLAVASPGPDFAVVLKNSIGVGRKAAMFTSLGVACGIMLHVSYSVLGIGLVISQSEWLFRLIQIGGASYLLWLGIQGLRTGKSEQSDIVLSGNAAKNLPKAFLQGLVTNGLNPKATLFFLSLFTLVVKVDTPWPIQLAYGAYLVLATGLWFMLISWLFSTHRMRRQFLRLGHWFERSMGIVLLGLGLRLLYQSV